MPDSIIETQSNPIADIQPPIQPVVPVQPAIPAQSLAQPVTALQPAPQPMKQEMPIITPSVKGNSIDAQIIQISEIAKANPNVDVANLMLSVLDQQHVNQADAKRKHWAYLISVGIPGAGFICAIYYYYFSGKSDAKHIAWWCAGLTIFTIIITWITTAVIFSSLTKGTAQQFNVSNLEQQPAQLQQLLNQ